MDSFHNRRKPTGIYGSEGGHETWTHLCASAHTDKSIFIEVAVKLPLVYGLTSNTNWVLALLALCLGLILSICERNKGSLLFAQRSPSKWKQYAFLATCIHWQYMWSSTNRNHQMNIIKLGYLGPIKCRSLVTICIHRSTSKVLYSTSMRDIYNCCFLKELPCKFVASFISKQTSI